MNLKDLASGQHMMLRVVILAAFLVFFLCPSAGALLVYAQDQATPSAPIPANTPSKSAQPAMSRLCLEARAAQAVVEQVRGERFKGSVSCVVKSRTEIGDYVRMRIAEELSSKELQYEGVIFKALGMIPAGVNYERAVQQVYEAALGGLYDPETKSFSIADWTSVESLKGIAIHELTHALQDQRFNLTTFVDFKALSGDQVLAKMAVVEGEATLVAREAEEAVLGRGSVFKRRTELQDELMGPFSAPFSVDAPAALQQMVQFPYHAGQRFLLATVRSDEYSAVDNIFERPPRSTEEILHPEKYEQVAEDFERVVIPHNNMTDEKVLFSDVLGEFLVRVLLRELGLDDSAAVDGASGWGGDLVQLQQRKGDSCLVRWHTRWDSLDDAREFVEAFQTGQQLKRGGSRERLLGGAWHRMHDGFRLRLTGGARTSRFFPIHVEIQTPAGGCT